MLASSVDYFWLADNPTQVSWQWCFKTVFAVYKKLTDKIVAVYTKKAYRSRGLAPITQKLQNQVELSYQFTPQLPNPPPKTHEEYHMLIK